METLENAVNAVNAVNGIVAHGKLSPMHPENGAMT